MTDPWRILEVPISIEQYTTLFTGIDAWLQWEIIGEVDLRLCVPPRSGSNVKIKVNCTHPNLLVGLEHWHSIGLLDDNAIKQWAAQHLSTGIVTANRMQETTIKKYNYSGSLAQDFSPDPFLPSSSSAITPQTQQSTVVKPIVPPNRSSQSRQSHAWADLMARFSAEFSLVWVLFLGIFLVVVSSAVLAASRWRNFPHTGQYLILLGYTLAFGGVATLIGQRERLKLTGMALSVGALMIIPVNFWAMSGLGLGRSTSGFILALASSILLSAMALLLLKRLQWDRYKWITILLCWLHLGWRSVDSIPIPLIATYTGLLIATTTLLATRQQEDTIRKSFATVSYGALLLLVRVCFFPGVSLQQLGLAFGLCGFICYRWRLDRQPGLGIMGISLLGIGWFLSIFADPPLQAFLISILGLWLTIEELWQKSSRLHLTFGFVLGGETLWLTWNLLPEALRSYWIQGISTWAQTDFLPSIVGLLFLPYALVMAFVGYGFHRAEKPLLSRHADQLALVFAIFLNYLTFFTPTTRAWSLTVTALGTIVFPLKYAEVDPATIFVSHLLTIGAVFLQVDLHFPNLSLEKWTILLLATTLLEWLFSGLLAQRNLSDRGQAWRDSTWLWGILIAAIGSVLLFTEVLSKAENPFFLCGLWLSLPTALLLLSFCQEHPRKELSGDIAIYSLILPVFFPDNFTRAMGLSIGAVLMSIPLRYWPVSPKVIFLTQLLTIGAVFFHLYAYIPEFSSEQWVQFLLVSAVLEWIASGILSSSTSDRGQAWCDSTWMWGLGLASIGSMVLFSDVLPQTDNTLLLCGLWLLLPTTLMGVSMLTGYRFNVLSRHIATCILFLTFSFPDQLTRSVGLGVATVLITLPVIIEKSQWLAVLQIFLGVSTAINILGTDRLYELFPTFGAASLILAIAPPLLQREPLSVYRFASSLWAMVLGIGIFMSFTFLTIGNFPVNTNEFIYDAFKQGLGGLGMATLGMGIVAWRAPQSWAWLVFLWGIALSIASGVILEQGTVEHLVIIYLSLGFVLEVLSPAIARLPIGQNEQFVTFAPVLLAILGTSLRITIFHSTSYLYTIGAALTVTGSGRRNPGGQPLVLLGVGGISFGCCEFAIGQFQATGIEALVVAAFVLALLAMGYYSFAAFLTEYLRINASTIGKFHWGIGLGIITTASPLVSSYVHPWIGSYLGTATLLLLAFYGFAVGRSQENWVYWGIATTIGAFYYTIYIAFPQAQFILEVLEPYGVAIACAIAVAFFLLPWQSWGWATRPWHRSGKILPIAIMFFTWESITPGSLLIAATLYGWLSHLQGQLRLSYISLFLINPAIWRLLPTNIEHSSLWYATTIGLSSLYCISRDPWIAGIEKRSVRYKLRLAATGIICGAALYESIDSLPIAFWSIIVGFAFTIAGLILQTRAYLYIGTTTFLATIVLQMAKWMGRNPFGIWGSGTLAGIALILVVAVIELKREQITQVWQHWRDELVNWE